MPEFYTILARKINKIPKFYMIFARKIFSRIFGGRAPRLLRLCTEVTNRKSTDRDGSLRAVAPFILFFGRKKIEI